ncbi:Heteropolysaccharide repeat unit export protein, partial [uncultured Rubrobacteraceae bacterium]
AREGHRGRSYRGAGRRAGRARGRRHLRCQSRAWRWHKHGRTGDRARHRVRDPGRHRPVARRAVLRFLHRRCRADQRPADTFPLRHGERRGTLRRPLQGARGRRAGAGHHNDGVALPDSAQPRSLRRSVLRGRLYRRVRLAERERGHDGRRAAGIRVRAAVLRVHEHDRVGHPGFPDRNLRSLHPAAHTPRAVPRVRRRMLRARGEGLRRDSRLRARDVPGRARRTLLPQETIPHPLRPPGAYHVRDQGPLWCLDSDEHHAGCPVPQQLLGHPDPRRIRRRGPGRHLQRRSAHRNLPDGGTLRLFRHLLPHHLRLARTAGYGRDGQALQGRVALDLHRRVRAFPRDRGLRSRSDGDLRGGVRGRRYGPHHRRRRAALQLFRRTSAADARHDREPELRHDRNLRLGRHGLDRELHPDPALRRSGSRHRDGHSDNRREHGDDVCREVAARVLAGQRHVAEAPDGWRHLRRRDVPAQGHPAARGAVRVPAGTRLRPHDNVARRLPRRAFPGTAMVVRSLRDGQGVSRYLLQGGPTSLAETVPEGERAV